MPDDEFESFIIKGVLHFEAVTEHPEGIHGLCNSGDRGKDAPEKVLKAVKEWRAANNKPGFKSE